jgi:hypothetical protein
VVLISGEQAGEAVYIKPNSDQYCGSFKNERRISQPRCMANSREGVRKSEFSRYKSVQYNNTLQIANIET